jgi:PTH1 family peptidyl-tRNA hydrolase
MFLLAGLGNPDQKYQKNRHNAGYIILDFFDSNTIYKKKFKSLFAEKNICNKKFFFLKPLTFMNLSGVAIAEIKQFFKINNNNIFVCHDDLDLETGKIKVKNGGSNGGHNGLESISENIGNDYNRIRIGIDHPGNKELVEKYVLTDFKDNELKIINNSFFYIKNNMELLINKKFDEFNSKVNNIL